MVVGRKGEELEDKGTVEVEEEREPIPPWRLYCSAKVSGYIRRTKKHERESGLNEQDLT